MQPANQDHYELFIYQTPYILKSSLFVQCTNNFDVVLYKEAFK